jgi:enamine deaminase RidA (YjgF/YER057c/UK114 family)
MEVVETFPYSPGILVGDTLYLSGQLGRDPATAKLVPEGIEAESPALTHSGGTF